MKRRLLRICALVGAMTLGLSAAAQEHIDMLAVDHRLYELGYRDGACNGVLDEITINALKNFQLVNGLDVTGEPDDPTVSRLLGDGAVSEKEYLMNISQSNTAQDMLTNGSYGDRVSRLQRVLKSLGYFNGSSDGAYGAETQAAVYRFQLANGLQETGNADGAVFMRIYAEDPVTWREFLEKSCASVGDSGANVRTLQIWLMHKGYFKGECTGRYGDGTQQAVKRFQADMQLESSGDLDMDTCSALYWDVEDLIGDENAIRRGEAGTDVENFCHTLALLGYPAHARFNMQTELALMQFQLVNKLNVNGVADVATQVRLYSGYAQGAEEYEPVKDVLPETENLNARIYRQASGLLGQLSEMDTDFGFVQYVALKCGIKLMNEEQLSAIELGEADAVDAGEFISVQLGEREIFGVSTGDKAIIYRADNGYIVVSYLEAMEPERVVLHRVIEE